MKIDVTAFFKRCQGPEQYFCTFWNVVLKFWIEIVLSKHSKSSDVRKRWLGKSFFLVNVSFFNRFQPFDFNRVFPSLGELDWSSLGNFSPQNQDSLAKVTKLTRGAFQRNPFEVLTHLVSAQKADFTCYEYSDEYQLVPFENPNLRSLTVECPDNDWSFEEFKAAFSYFPNLTELVLRIRGLNHHFYEKVGSPKQNIFISN